MYKLLVFIIATFVALDVGAVNNKKKAYSSVQHFFKINQQKLILEGHFVETDAEFGSSCKINVNFSKVGKEYLTIAGEYTPAGNIGDGIYFNEDESSFIHVDLLNGQLTLEQKLSDSLSTGTKSTVELSKNHDTLQFSLYQQTFFLFIPQVVKKKCVVEHYLQK